MTTTNTPRQNKADAGNGSKAICRVSNVLRSPSPDPKRSAKKLKSPEVMRVFISSDANWDAKIDHATRTLDAKRYFESRNYGAGLANLTVILNCRDPELGHKQRVRFTKATKTLGIDVMLPLDRFVRVPHQERRLMIADSMLKEIPRLVRKYNLPEFETEQFLDDFERYVTGCLLSPEADRFDHLCLP